MNHRMSRVLAFVGCLLWPLAVVFAPEALQAEAASDLDLETIATGFVRPVAIRHSGDGTGRLFVVEQAGKIRVLKGGQHGLTYDNPVPATWRLRCGGRDHCGGRDGSRGADRQ